MSTARMPVRATRVDRSNCCMTDEELQRQDRAYALWSHVEDDHDLPAMVWWAVVAVVGVGGFVAGILLGSQS